MRVGFVGCGTMGEHMARNIVKNGNELSVFDINMEPLQRLQKDGASIKQRPADVASASDVTVLMVVNDQQTRDVICGENGLLEGLQPGGTIVIMSTITPGVCVEMAEVVRAAGGDLMEAPVVLSQPAAIAGELGIYMGGAPETCEKAKPVLECMGKNIIRMGDVGTAMAMKLCHNMMTATIAQAVSEMIMLGTKAGLDFDDMITAVSYGGGQNSFLDSKAATIKERDFVARFSLANMNKDMGLALIYADKLGACMPAGAAAKQMASAAMAAGLGPEDFSAFVKINEKASNV